MPVVNWTSATAIGQDSHSAGFDFNRTLNDPNGDFNTNWDDFISSQDTGFNVKSNKQFSTSDQVGGRTVQNVALLSSSIISPEWDGFDNLDLLRKSSSTSMIGIGTKKLSRLGTISNAQLGGANFGFSEVQTVEGIAHDHGILRAWIGHSTGIPSGLPTSVRVFFAPKTVNDFDAIGNPIGMQDSGVAYWNAPGLPVEYMNGAPVEHKNEPDKSKLRMSMITYSRVITTYNGSPKIEVGGDFATFKWINNQFPDIDAVHRNDGTGFVSSIEVSAGRPLTNLVENSTSPIKMGGAWATAPGIWKFFDVNASGSFPNIKDFLAQGGVKTRNGNPLRGGKTGTSVVWKQSWWGVVYWAVNNGQSAQIQWLSYASSVDVFRGNAAAFDCMSKEARTIYGSDIVSSRDVPIFSTQTSVVAQSTGGTTPVWDNSQVQSMSYGSNDSGTMVAVGGIGSDPNFAATHKGNTIGANLNSTSAPWLNPLPDSFLLYGSFRDMSSILEVDYQFSANATGKNDAIGSFGTINGIAFSSQSHAFMAGFDLATSPTLPSIPMHPAEYSVWIGSGGDGTCVGGGGIQDTKNSLRLSSASKPKPQTVFVVNRSNNAVTQSSIVPIYTQTATIQSENKLLAINPIGTKLIILFDGYSYLGSNLVRNYVSSLFDVEDPIVFKNFDILAVESDGDKIFDIVLFAPDKQVSKLFAPQGTDLSIQWDNFLWNEAMWTTSNPTDVFQGRLTSILGRRIGFSITHAGQNDFKLRTIELGVRLRSPKLGRGRWQ